MSTHTARLEFCKQLQSKRELDLGEDRERERERSTGDCFPSPTARESFGSEVVNSENRQMSTQKTVYQLGNHGEHPGEITIANVRRRSAKAPRATGRLRSAQRPGVHFLTFIESWGYSKTAIRRTSQRRHTGVSPTIKRVFQPPLTQKRSPQIRSRC